VDSDDETDEEEVVDDESDEDKPQVVGDIEIDMGEEEEEFLEFSRQALGITDEQWHGIIQDRQGRGGKFPCWTKSQNQFNIFVQPSSRLVLMHLRRIRLQRI
jgi:hypothetical protein